MFKPATTPADCQCEESQIDKHVNKLQVIKFHRSADPDQASSLFDDPRWRWRSSIWLQSLFNRRYRKLSGVSCSRIVAMAASSMVCILVFHGKDNTLEYSVSRKPYQRWSWSICRKSPMPTHYFNLKFFHARGEFGTSQGAKCWTTCQGAHFIEYHPKDYTPYKTKQYQ